MASRPLQRVQAAIAARRHFLGRQTKSQIADDLSISRFKVARLIEAAIEEGSTHVRVGTALFGPRKKE